MKPGTNGVCDTLQVLNFKIFVDSVKSFDTEETICVFRIVVVFPQSYI